MTHIRFKRSTVLNRIGIFGGLFLCSLGFLYSGIFLEETFLRKTIAILCSITGFYFFGRLLSMIVYILATSTVLFSYNKTYISIGSVKIRRDEIKKATTVKSVPIDFLGLTSPSLVVHKKSNEKIFIPTYYLVTPEDSKKLVKLLKSLSA